MVIQSIYLKTELVGWVFYSFIYNVCWSTKFDAEM